MAKTKNAFFSETAQGAVGPIQVENLRHTQYVRAKIKPKDKKSPNQMDIRKKYGEAVQAWRGLTPEERDEYNAMAVGMQISGFNFFVKYFFAIKEIAIYGVGVYGVNAYGDKGA